MKVRILALALAVMIGSGLFWHVRQAQANIQPVLAVDHVFTALSAGEIDTAVASFAEEAIIENLMRRETYVGPAEIRQMLQGMQRDGRQYDIVGVDMAGDTITLQVEVTDHGLVWGRETIVAEVRDGKIQTFKLTAFRLHL